MRKQPFPEFGERVNKKMREKRLQASDLMTLLDVKRPATISDWRQGKVLPEGANLTGLASMLGVSTDWLLRGALATPGKVSEQTADYSAIRPEAFWDGVEYAAEIMSDSLTRMLRERREAREAAAAGLAVNPPAIPPKTKEARKAARHSRRVADEVLGLAGDRTADQSR